MLISGTSDSRPYVAMAYWPLVAVWLLCAVRQDAGAQTVPRMVLRSGQPGGVSRIALSPDGDALAAHGSDGSLVLWDTRSGHQLWDTAHFSKGVPSLANWLPADGAWPRTEQVGIGGHRFMLKPTKRIWAFPSYNRLMRSKRQGWKEILPPETYMEQPTVMAVDSSAAELVLGRMDGVVMGVDTNGIVRWSRRLHNEEVTDLVIDKRARLLYSSSLDGSIAVLDLRLLELSDRYFERVERFSCSSLYGSRLQLGTRSGNVYEVDMQEPFRGVMRLKISHQPVVGVVVLNDSIRYAHERGSRTFRLRDGRARVHGRVNKWMLQAHFPKWIKPGEQFRNLWGLPVKTLSGIIQPPSRDCHIREMMLDHYAEVKYDLVDYKGRRTSLGKTYSWPSEAPVVFLSDSVVVCADLSMADCKRRFGKDKGSWRRSSFKERAISWSRGCELRVSVVHGFSADHLCRLNGHEFLLVDTGCWYVQDLYSSERSVAFAAKLVQLFALDDDFIAYEDSAFAVHLARKDGAGLSEYAVLQGHRADVVGVHFWKEGHQVVTVSMDGTIGVWDESSGARLYTVVPVGRRGVVAITDSGYFASSGRVSDGFAFVDADQVIGLDQMDLMYNRPDIIMRLNGTDSSIVHAYALACRKRWSRSGLPDPTSGALQERPRSEVLNAKEESGIATSGFAHLKVRMDAFGSGLASWNVMVNEVPLFGRNGIPIPGQSVQMWLDSVAVPLSYGQNVIEVTGRNLSGLSSFSRPLHVRYEPTDAYAPKVYFIGIGLDNHGQPGHDLRYAVKDVRDLVKGLRGRYGDRLVVDTLFDRQVSRERVADLRKHLLSTSVNDKVIVAFSGHGLLSKEYDYYLATHAMDFSDPANGGLPYEELEALLDSIPARQKLLLIDACHSGEVDREELLAQETTLPAGTRGAPLEYGYSPVLGMKNSFELMQELFANVSRGTGATVISAAGGTQFAYEGNGLDNGVFTASILELLRRKGHVRVSELKEYVGRRVVELTNGNQRPTTRTETVEFDWEVW